MSFSDLIQFIQSMHHFLLINNCLSGKVCLFGCDCCNRLEFLFIEMLRSEIVRGWFRLVDIVFIWLGVIIWGMIANSKDMILKCARTLNDNLYVLLIVTNSNNLKNISQDNTYISDEMHTCKNLRCS